MAADEIHTGNTAVDQWFDRIRAGLATRETWEKDNRVADGYQFWRGNQLAQPFDAQKERKAQINKIHPMVRSQIPSLYFNRPFARVQAAPEKSDTPLETVSEKAQLLQDTGNYFVRNPDTCFKEATDLAIKEHFWSLGCVEVGYSPNFVDNPDLDRPAQKENEDTKPDTPASDSDSEDDDAPMTDDLLAQLRASLKSERFYVKFVSAKQVICSPSDKAIIADNDWIGYWEDFAVEDVKRSKAYKHTRGLKPSVSCGKDDKGEATSQNVRLFKIWDLRTKTRWVFAEGHKRELLKKSFKRLPLKFYRPDIDPYHFWPIPPISQGLSRQEEYNRGREWMRKVQRGTVPRFTYNQDAFDQGEIEKLESEDPNIFIGRKGNVTGPDAIVAIAQPNVSAIVLQDLQLTEKEFNEQTGTPAESRQAQTGGAKTATQATLQAQQSRIEDSLDRSKVATWLAEIVEELILLALDHMNLSEWIAVNVDADSPLAMVDALAVAKTYKEINAEVLQGATSGIRWHVEVDVDTLSPQAEEQKLQKVLQIINYLGNPAQAALLANSPQLLSVLLKGMGLRSSSDQAAVKEALGVVVKMHQMSAAQGVGTPGVAPTAGQPGPAPAPQPPQLPPGIPGVTQ